MEEKTSSSLMHDFTGSSGKKKSSKTSANPMKYLGIFLVVILLGVGTGFAIASMRGTAARKAAGVPTYNVSTGKVFGTQSTEGYDAEAPEGILKEGGKGGEGAFHIEREGGEARFVYITSSNVDLSQFVGKKVKVWGKSQQAQNVGWLLDVGRLEVQ